MLFVTLSIVFLLVPSEASAHVAVSGSDGFVIGLLHPIQEFQQALAIVSAGLFIGQQSLDVSRKGTGSFLCGLAAGLCMAFLESPPFFPGYVTHSVTFIAGVLIAVARPINSVVSILFAAICGVVIGLALVPETATWAAITFTISGSAFSTFLMVFYGVIGTKWLLAKTARPWLAVGLRILGSWFAAISMLMLALAIR